MHPGVAKQIRELIMDPDFAYDVIEVPFHRYALGVGTKESPWYSEYAQCVARKNVMQVNRGGVHDALQITSRKVFRLKRSDTICIYHLTHETVNRYDANDIYVIGGEKHRTFNVSI